MRQGFVGNGCGIVIVSKPVVGTVRNGVDRAAVAGFSLRGTRFSAMAVHVEVYGTGTGFIERVREIANSGYIFHVSLSVHMEQLGSNLTEFHEI